jgi:hypothetical protein
VDAGNDIEDRYGLVKQDTTWITGFGRRNWIKTEHGTWLVVDAG